MRKCVISRLSASGPQGRQPEQGNPGSPLPGHFHLLSRADTEPAEGYSLSSVSLVCPGVTSYSTLPTYSEPLLDVLYRYTASSMILNCRVTPTAATAAPKLSGAHEEQR